jgi:uncharacterized RDD family membrane protein YckC
MTQHTAGPSLGCHPTSPDYTPPLRLKPKPPPSGYVDGAWWPYSDDLLQELPDLLAVLSVRLGPIQRVLYNLGEWAQAPAKVAMGGRIVRLDGFRSQPVSTLAIRSVNRNAIVLLVVPAGTQPEQAHTTMMAAATPKDGSTVGGLLASSAPAS